MVEFVQVLSQKTSATQMRQDLFFPVLPKKTLYFKSEKCSGGKGLKERLTVLLCSNIGDVTT